MKKIKEVEAAEDSLKMYFLHSLSFYSALLTYLEDKQELEEEREDKWMSPCKRKRTKRGDNDTGGRTQELKKVIIKLAGTWKMYYPHSLSFSSVLLIDKKRRTLREKREEEVKGC